MLAKHIPTNYRTGVLCLVWGPQYKKDIDMLGWVQKAIKMKRQVIRHMLC